MTHSSQQEMLDVAEALDIDEKLHHDDKRQFEPLSRSGLLDAHADLKTDMPFVSVHRSVRGGYTCPTNTCSRTSFQSSCGTSAGAHPQ